jgi:hypothetical protein
MNTATPNETASLDRELQHDDLRENVSCMIREFFPDFSIPECVDVSLVSLGQDLLRLKLNFPSTAGDDGERAEFVYDLYENLTYLFGKGFYDAHHDDDARDESMVWYVPTNQRIARQMMGWMKSARR